MEKEAGFKGGVVRTPVGAANSRPRAHSMRLCKVLSYLNALLGALFLRFQSRPLFPCQAAIKKIFSAFRLVGLDSRDAQDRRQRQRTAVMGAGGVVPPQPNRGTGRGFLRREGMTER